MYDLSTLADPYPVEPVEGPLDAEVVVPGSKSVTNRALVCAALAEGTSVLEGALVADDTEAMLGVLASVGIDVAVDGTTMTVHGGGGAVRATDRTIDVRQSGTTARFALPLLLTGLGTYRVTAHPQMQSRPMTATIEALRVLGAQVSESDVAGHLPAAVTPPDGTSLGLAEVGVPGDASSQFLSGLLLVAPCLPDGLRLSVTTDLVSRPYVDLTIAVMESFGAVVDRPDGRTFVVQPSGYRARTYQVEPDASAASYPLAAAAVCGGRVRVRGLGTDALQGDVGFLDVLADLGATVTRDRSGSEVAGVRGTLKGGRFDLTHISDTAQTLAAIAPFALQPITVTGIGFIRRKEIDRVEAVATELDRLGVPVQVDHDGWTITPAPPRPTVVRTYDDHRMAMSFALCGLMVPGISIADPGCVAKTFPGYWQLLSELRTGST